MLICQILFEHARSFPTLYIFLSWHKYNIPWFFWSSRHFPHADSIFPQLPPAVRSSQLETSAWDHKQTSSFLPGVPSCLKKISQTDGVLEDQWQLYQIHVRAYGSSHPKKVWHQSTWLVNFYWRTIIPCTLLKFHSESSYLLPSMVWIPPIRHPYHPTTPSGEMRPPHLRWQCRRLLVDCPPGSPRHGSHRQTHKRFFSVPLCSFEKGDGNNHLISSDFYIFSYFLYT